VPFFDTRRSVAPSPALERVRPASCDDGPLANTRRLRLVYFFERDLVFIRCEIEPGSPHILTVTYPGGTVHTEKHASGDSLDEHWQELRAQFVRDGWSGPFGRDPRS
jgi:hypothetical protein